MEVFYSGKCPGPGSLVHWNPLDCTSSADVLSTLEWWRNMQFQRDVSTGAMLNPVNLSLNCDKRPAFCRTIHLMLGIDISGKDPLGFVKIHIMDPAVTVPTTPLADNKSLVIPLIFSEEVK